MVQEKILIQNKKKETEKEPQLLLGPYLRIGAVLKLKVTS